jgi:hypothetical protein
VWRLIGLALTSRRANEMALRFGKLEDALVAAGAPAGKAAEGG